MSVPHIIHYCWFGGNPKTELIQACLDSWRKYYPDFEIVEWNETNFNINIIPYTADAYKDKKWAFVTDYARLWIVHEHGGIYLDADIMMKSRCLAEWSEYDCWLVAGEIRHIATGLGFGAQKGHPIIKGVMDAYKDYTYPCGTNLDRDTPLFEQLMPGWEKSPNTQIADGVLIVGCNDFGRYATHLGAASWVDDESQRKTTLPKEKSKFQQKKENIAWKIGLLIHHPKIIKFMDKRRGSFLEKSYNFLTYDLPYHGVWYFFRRLMRKIFHRKGHK